MSSQKITFADLKTHLFAAADILRKSLNASENSKPVLTLLFLKRLNDVFEENAEKMMKENKKIGKEEAYGNPRRHDFFIPEDARWSVLEKTSEDIGPKIISVCKKIEEANQEDLTTPPPPGTYPFGFFSWKITGLTIGKSVDVTITYPSNPGTVYEKLIDGTWTPVDASVDGNVVTLHLKDGGSGDADLIGNGEITDPGGMVILGVTGQPVGGSGIPIDSTALLLAGVQGSALWVIPAILITGVGIGLFSFKKSKKT